MSCTFSPVRSSAARVIDFGQRDVQGRRLREPERVAERGLAESVRALLAFAVPVDVLYAGHEERPLVGVERVVAAVPGDGEALGEGVAGDVGEAKKLGELGGVAGVRAVRGDVLQVLRDRAEREDVRFVVLERLGEGELQLLERAIVDRRDAGELGEDEVVLEVVNGDAVDRPADEGAEADLGERRSSR